MFSCTCGLGILSKMATKFRLHIVLSGPVCPHVCPQASSMLGLGFLSNAKMLWVLSFPVLTVCIPTLPSSLLRAPEPPTSCLGSLHLWLSEVLYPSVYSPSSAWRSNVSIFRYAIHGYVVLAGGGMRTGQEWGVCITCEPYAVPKGAMWLRPQSLERFTTIFISSALRAFVPY